jgi:hypothetical protein
MQGILYAQLSTYLHVSRKPYKQPEVSPIGFHPKVVHLTCCFWTSCITWTLSVSWKCVVQIYGPSVHMTSYNKQLSVKWKVACFTVKIFKADICKGWLRVSECINANDGEGWRDWPCTYGVCNRSLGRIDILKTCYIYHRCLSMYIVKMNKSVSVCKGECVVCREHNKWGFYYSVVCYW